MTTLIPSLGGQLNNSKYPDDMEIAPGCKIRDWKKLRPNLAMSSSDDWGHAIEIFDARVRKRFILPIDLLIAKESGPGKTFGFAILAIDFLVIETLQGFLCGTTDHTRKSKGLITEFLKNWSAFVECLPSNCCPEERASTIYQSYRCALHHAGSTDGDFRVGISGPVFCFSNEYSVKINRTLFHEELKREFNRYKQQLHKSEEEVLRKNFLKKMDAICGICAAPTPRR